METAIKQDPPEGDRRKHFRVKRLGLSVRLDGKCYTTQDWSMGGFMLADYEGGLSTGALLTVVGLGPSTRKLNPVELPARVVRTDKHTMAVTFLSLDIKAYDFLQKLMCDNGEMHNLLDN